MAENSDDNKSGYKSRRQDRAKRRDVFKEWQNGRLDEEYRLKERWSREAKKAKPKVQKQEQAFVCDSQEVLVLEAHRRTALVRKPDGDDLKCWYASSLDLSDYGRLAPGDTIFIAREEGGEKFYVTGVKDRVTKLSRPGPRDRINSELVLAANIDRVCIVCSGVEEQFNPGFIDRYLLVCAYSGLDMVLVLNKKDIYETVSEPIQEFCDLATRTIYTSAKTGEGLDELRGVLTGGLSVLTGQSGVGKSSLIQALIPGLDLKTKEIRESDGKGKHATTVSTLYTLDENSQVIDTPGIRELGLWKMEKESVALYFPGFEGCIDACKFSDCTHQHEPGCAIIEAVENKEIAESRYKSYLRILNSL